MRLSPATDRLSSCQLCNYDANTQLQPVSAVDWLQQRSDVEQQSAACASQETAVCCPNTSKVSVQNRMCEDSGP